MRELRHLLATLQYRAAQSIDEAPVGYGMTAAGAGGRTPTEILAHMTTVLRWARGHVLGAAAWSPHDPGSWQAEVEAFAAAIAEMDGTLANVSLAPDVADQLRQGPLADCLTHVGQLALLRRLAGKPVPPQNYMQAAIEVPGSQTGPNGPAT